MKALILNKLNDPIRIEDRPRPEPASREILVRIRASGICHSDVHIQDGDMPVPRALPLIPGHEGAGTVEAVGRDVDGWKVGDRAGIPWLRWACGRCRECIEGWEALCVDQRGTGYDENGCWAEYAVCPAKFAARIPGSLAWEEAAPILCAGVTAYKAVKLSGTRPGRSLGVFGIGGLGHMGLQYGKLAGGRVIAIDINPNKLKLARELGADECIDASGGGAVRALRQAGGIDDAVVFATARSAIQDALEALNPNGRLVIASLPTGDVSVDAPDLTNRGLTLAGTSLGSRQDLSEALAIGAGGRVRARVETCRLEDANDILKSMREHRLDAARKVIKL